MVIVDRDRRRLGILDMTRVDYRASEPILPLTVRSLDKADGRDMALIEMRVWSSEHAATEEVIESRLSANAGSLGAYLRDSAQMVGFYTFCRINESQLHSLRTWADYAALAVKPWPQGDVMYGISLTVDDNAPSGTGTCLIRHSLLYARELGGRLMVNVTRAPHYSLVMNELSFDKYVGEITRGIRKEPLHHIMTESGFSLTGYCADYFPDPDSANYGLIYEATL